MTGSTAPPTVHGRALAKVFVGVLSRTGPRPAGDLIRRMRSIIEREGYRTGHFAATDVESIWVMGYLTVDQRFREATKDWWLKGDGVVTVEVEGVGGQDVKANQPR